MPDKLSPKEIEVLVSLLARVTPLPRMEEPVLKAIWENRLMPMNPMELIILKNPITPFVSQEVLLLYRDDKNFPDCWHNPGGYLGANEKIEDAIQRVALREIGIKVKNLMPVAMANFYNLARDHEFSLLVVCEPDGSIKTEKGKIDFFPLGKMPENLTPHHKSVMRKILDWLDFLRILYVKSPDLMETYFEVSSVLETLQRK